ncbi:hypothetical protein KUCAC02_034229, partial [Chaenocephalus aceratus]
SESSPRSESDPDERDVWAELKELRDIAIEHRIKIQSLEQDDTGDTADVKHAESHVTDAHDHDILDLINNSSLEATTSFSEQEVEELKIDTAEATRSSSEKEVQELKRENAALKASMSSSENDVEEVKRGKGIEGKYCL